MNVPEDITADWAVVQRVVDGDVDAFEDLVIAYQQLVFGIVARRVAFSDAESVAQDVFVSAFRSLKAYRPREPFRRWLSTIAVRRCVDYWRKKGRTRETTVAELNPAQADWLEQAASSDSREDFDQALARREAAEVLDLALRRIDPEERALIELVYFEDQPMKDAARILDISVSNAKIRTHRARQKLRSILGEMLV
jgi:RNA polymerase sigma-70 factor (ECF subfamily)